MTNVEFELIFLYRDNYDMTKVTNISDITIAFYHYRFFLYKINLNDLKMRSYVPNTNRTKSKSSISGKNYR